MRPYFCGIITLCSCTRQPIAPMEICFDFVRVFQAGELEKAFAVACAHIVDEAVEPP